MGLGPLPNMAAIVHVNMKGLINGLPWSNKLWLQYSGPAPQVTDLQNVGTSLSTAWTTNFAPLCPPTVTLTTIDLADMTNRQAATTTYTLVTPSPGSRTGTAMTNQVACVISWGINRRYRGGHPRSYLPAGVLGDTTTGHSWATAFSGEAGAAANAFLTAVNAITVSGTTYKMVSMNLVGKVGSPPAPGYIVPPVPYTVNSGRCRSRIDTQRRRLGKELV